MPRLSLWNPVKTHDFNFIDRIVGEFIYAGGTGVLVHKYMGAHGASTPTPDATRPLQHTNDAPAELFIQDLLFLENRDRKYDNTIYEMRGTYSIQDNDAFDLTQFGLFLQNDTMMMTFHIESMIQQIGRVLMAGDVIELPHLRDDLLLGTEGATNRFFVIEDSSRPAEGYDPRWWPHLWRIKCKPITDSQEFRDIIGTGENEDDIRNLLSKYEEEIRISDAIVAEADREVPFDPQYRDNTHLYFDPAEPDRPTIGLDFGNRTGYPVNGMSIVGSGPSFPTSGVDDGAYYLRTDFTPNRLFKKDGTRWIRISDDVRGTWNAANRVLTTFINNNNVTTNTDGTRTPEKVNLSKVVKPKNDN